MAAFSPKTWVTGEPLTASDFNTFLGIPLATISPGYGTLTTTDATPTIIAQITVPINTEIMIWGHVVAARSDHSAALLGRFGATYRRAAGNIVMAGQYADTFEDSAGAPLIAMGFTVPNLGYVYATGIAAQTWNWKAVYFYAVL